MFAVNRFPRFFGLTAAASLITICSTALVLAQPAADDPDRLYEQRENLASAARAADLWAPRAATDFAAAWRLSRACYWLGTHYTEQSLQRDWLERGVQSGETAVRLRPAQPEGHFWLAVNMGEYSQRIALITGLRYRGRIRDELERTIALDAGFQGGAAEAALGQWYFKVPRLLGGSRTKAEEHMRRALTYDPESDVALWFLSGVLVAEGRTDEARAALTRVVNGSSPSEFAPEARDFKRKASERLRTLSQ